MTNKGVQDRKLDRGMYELHARILKIILLNEYSQEVLYEALRDKGLIKDTEIISTILEKTSAIILEEREILAKVLDTLLLENEEMKHDELQRLRTLLEDQRIEYIRDLKNLPEIRDSVYRFVEDLKKG